MMKKALLTLSGLAVLAAGGIYSGQAWIKGHLQKESLIEQMEQAWNCRAHIDSTSVSLFSSPATVKLIGLRLAPRDEEVSKPVAQRASLSPESALVSAEEVVLAVHLTKIASGTVNVDELHLEGVRVRNEVDDEGKGSLEKLFKRPHSMLKMMTPSSEGTPGVSGNGGSAPPDPVAAPSASAPSTPTPDAAVAAPPSGAKPKHDGMKASDLKVDLAVKKAAITNGYFESVDTRGGTKTVVQNLQFALTDIDVSPDDLAAHNKCLFNVDAMITVDKTNDPKSQIANLQLTGSGTFSPFDPKTGDWNPDTDVSMTLRKGGLIGGAPLSQQKGKEFDRMKEYGVNLGDIAIGGVLENDATTQVHLLPSGKMIVKQDFALAFKDYEMTLGEKSWFNPQQDQMSATGKLLVSRELSDRVLAEAQKSLGDKYGKTLGDLAIAAVRVALMDDQGRIVLPLKAKGKMSKPDVKLDNILGDITDILKSAGTSFLDNLLKGSDDKTAPKSGEPAQKPEPAPQQK